MSGGPGWRGPSDDELSDEIRSHLEMAIRDRVARGESPDAAALAARREFGNVPLVRATTRDMWGWRWLDALSQDLRYALRGFARSPALVATILITLALGVGGVGAVFSVLDRMFLQAPPGVRDESDVSRIVLFRPTAGADVRVRNSVSFPDLADFRAVAGVAGVEGYDLETNPPFAFGSEPPRPRNLAFTSTGYFSLLGVVPAIGRFYTAAENKVDDPTPVLVISYSLWQRRYGGDASVLGRTVTIDGVVFQIIGVAARGFAGLDVDATEMWVPYSARSARFASVAMFSRAAGGGDPVLEHHGRGLVPIMRMRPDADRKTIESLLTTAYRRTAVGDDAGDSVVTVHATPLIEARGPHPAGEIDDRRMGIVWTVVVVAVIALIICAANVASLLVLRGLRRRHEIAVRLALGISRRRLMGQVITESVLLALVAGALSTAVAFGGGRFLRVSLLSAIHWPATVVGYRGSALLMAVALGAGLAAGVLPALVAGEPGIMDAMKAGSPGAGQSHPRVRGFLIILQASMCVVLLVCSGVFVQSLHRATTLDLGFQADRIVDLVVSTDPRVAEPMLLAAKAKVATIPGVDGVSIAAGLSLSEGGVGDLRRSNGDSLPSALQRLVASNVVDTGYMALEGIRVLRGRGFDGGDVATSRPVAVISRQLAQEWWGAEGPTGERGSGGDPLSDCLYVAMDDKGRHVGPCVAIVGIVSDTRTTVTGPMAGHVYFPLTQPPLYQVPPSYPRYMGGVLAIRLAHPPTAAQLGAIRTIANTIPPGVFGAAQVRQPLVDLRPELAPWRVAAVLFSAFGIVTLFLAGVGLYGLIGYDVTCRTRELGIRIALGAQARDVVRIVVSSGVRIAVIASATGIVVALGSVRLIASLLFDTSPSDPAVLASVVMLVMVVGVVASVIPAWRATQVDPVIVLRAE